MTSIFLSYSSQDEWFVQKLAKRLESQGVTVWRDKAELHIGDALIYKIGKAVEEADFVVIVLSYNSINSRWVQEELQIALHRELEGQGKVVLPLLLTPVELPPFLKGKVYADFTNPQNFETSFQQLLKTLGVPARKKWLESAAMILAIIVFIAYVIAPQESPDSVQSDQLQPVMTVSPGTIILELVAQTPAPTVMSAEQAIREYYSVIELGDYNVSWRMISDGFNPRLGTDPVKRYHKYVTDWQESGPAVIVEPIEVVENGDSATATITLNYPKKRASHNIRYYLRRDNQKGDQRFGYWLFEYSVLLY